MLSKRQLQIINILLEKEGYQNSEELSKKIGVSSKTIRFDMETIALYMDDYDVLLESKRGYGYRLVTASRYSKDNLKRAIVSLSFFDHDDAKKAFIYCYIMIYNHYVTQEYLSNILYSNRNAIQGLVKEINKELDYVGVSVVPVSGKGYRIVGQEQCQRMAFVNYFDILKRNDRLYREFIDNNPYITTLYSRVEVVGIRRITDKYNIELSELNINKLQTYIILLIHRLQYNHLLTRLNEDSFVIKPIQPILDLSRKILTDNKIDPSNREVRLLSVFILFLIDVVDTNSVIGNSYSPVFEDFEYLIDSFFTRRNQLYNYIFLDVDTLKESVKSLIAIVIDENLLGYKRNLDLDNQFGDEFYVAIEITSLLFFQFENMIKLKFNQTNIILVALFINLSFRNNIWIKQQDVYVISHESLLYSELLKRRLISRFKDAVNVHIITTDIALRNVLKQNPDAIVINDEYGTKAEKNRYCFPTLLYTEIVINSLSSTLSTTSQANQQFLSSLKRECSLFASDMTEFLEVIQFLTVKYKCDKERSETIRHNVMTRENRYVSVIKNGVAAPRIYIDTISEPLIEIFTFQNSLLFNGAEISMVIALILPGSYERLTLVGRPLLDIINNIELVNDLKHAETFSDLIMQLNEFLG